MRVGIASTVFALTLTGCNSPHPQPVLFVEPGFTGKGYLVALSGRWTGPTAFHLASGANVSSAIADLACSDLQGRLVAFSVDEATGAVVPLPIVGLSSTDEYDRTSDRRMVNLEGCSVGGDYGADVRMLEVEVVDYSVGGPSASWTMGPGLLESDLISKIDLARKVLKAPPVPETSKGR